MADLIRRILLRCSAALTIANYSSAVAAQSIASTLPNGAEIAQVNVCGAGQWFTVLRNQQCETHPGVSVNPVWIGYTTADGYSRWRSHQATADSLWKAGSLIWLGDHTFVALWGFKDEHPPPPCFPQLPATSAQIGSPPVQVPGCKGVLLDPEPWSQRSQCAPSSGLSIIIRLLVADHLKVPMERVGLESRFIRDLGADALDVREIIMAAYETFPAFNQNPPVQIEKGEDPIAALSAGGEELLAEADRHAERLVTVQDLLSDVSSKICR
jgi:hypothetical protein